MRIQKTDDLERLCSDLREATGRGHTSQSFDQVVRYYLRQYGHGVREGQLEAALEIVADEAGHGVASQVTDVREAPELSVRYDVDMVSSVGG
jgi:Xaa-Pro aminopeptidase